MGMISINVDVHFIRDAIQDEAESYVKRIMSGRKEACIEAAGDVLDEHGYLPDGTVWVAYGDECWFSVDKGTGTDLAHYFHEGIMYGPNFFVKKLGEWRSPKDKKKYPNGKMLNQYPGSPSGVQYWTEAIQPGGPLFNEYIWRCEEILRR